MIIKLKSTLVSQEEKYLGHTYRLANEGWLRWVVLQSLVVLWLKLGIVRLVERIHVELKRVRSASCMIRRMRCTYGLHLRNHILCRIHVVQTIILTGNVIVGVVRVIFVVVGHRR
jgi:hypothetical protein